jgi:hypothetical protein
MLREESYPFSPILWDDARSLLIHWDGMQSENQHSNPYCTDTSAPNKNGKGPLQLKTLEVDSVSYWLMNILNIEQVKHKSPENRANVNSN